ncbi:hypothetical protein [Brachyspira sp.]|uniref:alginate O-acetyltransferase AlgX-related protein n=1 Tax=Brachyspira sp. TaxID=1977261 RepID=UPI002605CD49|nr:hypothetical protein [Brachyspira sp.]
MKDKKLFKILLYAGISLILILFILGNISRKGYLSLVSINMDDTLKINNIDIEETKKLFILDNELDYSNYIFTNSNISKYSYNFRISYYSKIFRNSDIYGVYLNTNSLPDYINNVEFQEKGTPFGIFISSVKIEENKIDNIKYNLRLKFSFIMILFLSFILLNIFINFIIKYNFCKNINFVNRYIFILVVFLCFLIMPNIIYKVFYNKFDHTNYEGRIFATKPAFSLKEIHKYPQLFEMYFNDSVAFRNELIKLKTLLDRFLFHNVFNSRVFLAKDNWLFLKDNWVMDKYFGLDYEHYTYEKLEQYTNNLLFFRDELSKRGIDFILMVCNDKQFIYDEYMPNYIKRKSTVSSTDKILEYITNNTDIKVLYTKDNLLKYKYKYQLYCKYDTHWNYLGGYIGYMSLMEVLKFPYINIDNLDILTFNGIYEEKYKYNGVYNDMARMLSLNKFDFYNDDNYYIISNYLEEQYFLNAPDTHGHYFKTFSSNNYAIDKKLFIIRDSYMHNMIDYISTMFKEVIYVHPETFDYTAILNENPDILIFETVERGLHYHLDKIVTSHKIIEMNKDLKTYTIETNY